MSVSRVGSGTCRAPLALPGAAPGAGGCWPVRTDAPEAGQGGGPRGCAPRPEPLRCPGAQSERALSFVRGRLR